MDFVCKLYGNTYAVHVTVALVGVATLNQALPAPPENLNFMHIYVAQFPKGIRLKLFQYMKW